MNIRLSALTDVGMIRDHNEDNFTIIQNVFPATAWDYCSDGFQCPEHGTLLLVADGMGGTNAGEVASSIVVNVIEEEFKTADKLPEKAKDKEAFLKKAIITAKKQIVSEAKSNIEYRGMGTTVVIAWVVETQCHLAWVGDSRAYRLSKNSDIEIVSRDHSLVWELMEKGMLTEEEAETHPDSNIITQSLSDSGSKLKPETSTIELNEGDKLLLCSDGLNGMVAKPVISAILGSNQGEVACNKLVAEANKNGGTDNITVVLLEVEPFWSNMEDDGVELTTKYEAITEKNIADTDIQLDEKVTKNENEDNTVANNNELDAESEKSNKIGEDEKQKSEGFLKKIWNKIVTPIIDDEVNNEKLEKTDNKSVGEQKDTKEKE